MEISSFWWCFVSNLHPRSTILYISPGAYNGSRIPLARWVCKLHPRCKGAQQVVGSPNGERETGENGAKSPPINPRSHPRPLSINHINLPRYLSDRNVLKTPPHVFKTVKLDTGETWPVSKRHFWDDQVLLEPSWNSSEACQKKRWRLCAGWHKGELREIWTHKPVTFMAVLKCRFYGVIQGRRFQRCQEDELQGWRLSKNRCQLLLYLHFKKDHVRIAKNINYWNLCGKRQRVYHPSVYRSKICDNCWYSSD